MSFLLDTKAKLSQKTLDNIKKYLELKKGGAVSIASAGVGIAAVSMGYLGFNGLKNHQEQLNKVIRALGEIDKLQGDNGNSENVIDIIKQNSTKIESILGKVSLEVQRLDDTIKDAKRNEYNKRSNVHRRINSVNQQIKKNDEKRESDLKQVESNIQQILTEIDSLKNQPNSNKEEIINKFEEINLAIFNLNNNVVQQFNSINGEIYALKTQLETIREELENKMSYEDYNEIAEAAADQINVLLTFVNSNRMKIDELNKRMANQPKYFNDMKKEIYKTIYNLFIQKNKQIKSDTELANLKMLEMSNEYTSRINQLENSILEFDIKIEESVDKLKTNLRSDPKSAKIVERILKEQNIKNINKRLQSEEQARKKQIQKEKTVRKNQVTNINKRISKQEEDLTTTLDQLRYEISSISSDYEEKQQIQGNVNAKMVEAISTLHRKLKKTPFGTVL